MAYGNIDLTAKEIAYLTDQNREVLLEVTDKFMKSESDPERDFYRGSINMANQNLERLSSLATGKHAFTEDQLSYMKALVGGLKQRSLLAAWSDLKRSDATAAGVLEAEIDLRSSLYDRFEKPFVDDTSQDAEPDEDTDDDDDHQDAHALAMI